MDLAKNLTVYRFGLLAGKVKKKKSQSYQSMKSEQF
jgi:hypothetical protein